jgi:hypothetical protein
VPDDDVVPMEPLRNFLKDALPSEPIDLDDNEIITDAVVLFRVVDISEAGLERYRYTTTSGVTLGMAMGMITISQTTLMDYYTRLLADEEEDDDDGS